jgi:hypothetical protein
LLEQAVGTLTDGWLFISFSRTTQQDALAMTSAKQLSVDLQLGAFNRKAAEIDESSIGRAVPELSSRQRAS